MTRPSKLVRELQAAIGASWVLHRPKTSSSTSTTPPSSAGMPEAVVLPDSAEEVAAAVRIARAHGVPVIPRGAGTGLCGGAVACEGGVVIVTTRMNRILEVDVENRLALVEPGVVNLDLSKAVAPHGLYYAPDPSSQRACTIGGNVAENAGGPHCLRLRRHHEPRPRPRGRAGRRRDRLARRRGRDLPGYDLTGVVVGSEGTLCIVTKALVRLLRMPESTRTLLAIFDSVDAGHRRRLARSSAAASCRPRSR